MSIKSRLLTYCPFPIVIAACLFAVACRGEAHSAPADTRPTTVDEQMPSRLAVSQYLIGQNDWGANLPDSIWPVVGASGVKIVRIGGTGYNRTPLDNATLLHQVDEIRSIGAEPLIQVSNIAGADAAAATVQYINVTNGRHVTFWSIGNEPDGQMRGSTAAQIAAYIQSYITQIAPAMRDVDPAIKIVGPELSYYNATTFGDLLGGAYDISGTDSKHRYYLVASPSIAMELEAAIPAPRS